MENFQQGCQGFGGFRGFTGFRGCISLRARTDRQAQALDQFRKLGWQADDVTFLLVDRHPTDSEQGIFESHQACLKLGLASGASLIAVFEDDVWFDRLDGRHGRHGVRVMDFLLAAEAGRSGLDWDILFLGCFATRYRATAWPGIFRIRYQSTAHAYLMTADMARRLSTIPWQGQAWDDMLRDLPDGRYLAVYPSIAFQSNSASDNDKTRAIDRTRRLLGGMARLQKLNEWMCRHFRMLVVAHGLAGAMAAAFILWRVWR